MTKQENAFCPFRHVCESGLHALEPLRRLDAQPSYIHLRLGLPLAVPFLTRAASPRETFLIVFLGARGGYTGPVAGHSGIRPSESHGERRSALEAPARRTSAQATRPCDGCVLINE